MLRGDFESSTAAHDQATARQLIRRAWSETAPSTPFDETLTWRDSGIDSLKTLHFLLRLEQLLGRRVSFDLITRDMTLGELEIALAKLSGARPAPATDLKTIFLLPGIFGDEANLAEFRRSLVDRVRFETLPLTDIDQPTAHLADLNATATHIVEQVEARQPHGPLYLAGYSLGGLLAFQAATDLIARGRNVRFVCLLDAMLGHDMQAMIAAHPSNPTPAYLRADVWTRFLSRQGESLGRYIQRALIRMGRMELARRLAVTWAGHEDVAVNNLRRRRLLGVLRERAARSWRPCPCPSPVLLIASDDFARYCRVDAWAGVAANLTVQRVSGSHTEIFEPAALEVIIPSLLAALERAAALEGH